jgi:aryl-alcohol dehydrogenase-like predicted oxidoreductase
MGSSPPSRLTPLQSDLLRAFFERGRSEIKDLVDFKFLSESGLDLCKALDDAERKDAGMDPATLAWVLEQVTISAAAPIPGGIDPGEIDGFRRSLVRELRALAFTRVRSR